jgi:hypothetical protein
MQSFAGKNTETVVPKGTFGVNCNNPEATLTGAKINQKKSAITVNCTDFFIS